MPRCTFVLLALLSAAGAAAMTPARAAAGTEDLGHCLIHATTPADRKVLVRWAFATLALDPDVAPLASISPAQRTAIDRQAGGVVTDLLASACPAQVRRALANGGPDAIQAALETWGQWAVAGLVAEPQVMQGMAGLLEYIDIGRLMSLLPLQGFPPAGGAR